MILEKRQAGGFTLIELLVVLSIVGLLSSVILSSVNEARVRARDARRMSDLRAIQSALELYYDKYGTYLVPGTGLVGSGVGYAGYENARRYIKAITRGLQEEGFLSAPLVDDPSQSPGYMLFLCESGQVYALFATKEQPSAQDTSFLLTTCNGVAANSTYGKNYGVGNKSY